MYKYQLQCNIRMRMNLCLQEEGIGYLHQSNEFLNEIASKPTNPNNLTILACYSWRIKSAYLI